MLGTPIFAHLQNAYSLFTPIAKHFFAYNFAYISSIVTKSKP